MQTAFGGWGMSGFLKVGGGGISGFLNVGGGGGRAPRFEHPFTIVGHNFLQEPVLEYQISNHACFSCVKRLHWNGNFVYLFLFWELRGLSLYFHIHVSVSDLYIPRISPHISSSRKGRPILGIYMYNSLTDT
jgi:hypothetical protein